MAISGREAAEVVDWNWQQEVTYTTSTVRGDRGLVLMITQDGKHFTAAVAEGDMATDGTFTEDAYTLIGNRFKSAQTAQRACERYARAWRRAAVTSPQLRDTLSFVEAASHAMRVAGVIAQA